MTAEELYNLTHDVLESVGYPRWAGVNDPDAHEELVCLTAGPDEPVQWALMPVVEGDADESECLEIDVDMAASLIREHLRSVLLHRGWQVQVAMRKDKRRWRLVDCLSVADGGGDRLDDGVDYPWGEDELTVLCESVRVLLGAT